MAHRSQEAVGYSMGGAAPGEAEARSREGCAAPTPGRQGRKWEGAQYTTPRHRPVVPLRYGHVAM